MIRNRLYLVPLGVALFAVSTSAQTNTFPASGNVGIGTTSPAQTLVVGDITGQNTLRVNGLGSASAAPVLSLFRYANAEFALGAIASTFVVSVNPTGYSDAELGSKAALSVTSIGKVGIGTTIPAATLSVLSTNTNYALFANYNSFSPAFTWLSPSGQLSILGTYSHGSLIDQKIEMGSYNTDVGNFTSPFRWKFGVQSYSQYDSSFVVNSYAVNSNSYTGTPTETTRLVISGAGNVGIGTTTAPVQKLEVNGNVQVDSGIYFAGDPTHTAQTTPWTGVLCGGDYAEAVNAKGSLKTYEPGDVLVIGDGTEGEVQKSAEPYSTMVAGIFATKPGVIGRRQTLLKGAEEIPMAMVGIVPTKVTTENGPIHRGDLLVTSSNTGYAMKGTDRSRLVGAVIGKAMGSLETGSGVIEVLVTLQ